MIKRFLKKFIKSDRGAEIVEYILLAIIGVALCAVAYVYISNVISSYNSTVSNYLITSAGTLG